ncbi:hypothetical protein ACO2Q3_20305 [Caulobacter sp. KR2-114]|uniref:hypothetical protein n=1 Tax=Caulobacter sp. KR2-114 TaxID=3400912 RepID=UPI003BFED800
MSRAAGCLAALAVLAVAAATPALARSPWRLASADGETMLTDGDGEDMAASLRCKPHAGRIDVTFLVDHNLADHQVGDTWADKAGHRAPWAVTVHAASGAAAADIAGKANADQMNGGSEIDLVLPAASPVAQAFAASGALKLTAFGETPKLPPAPAALAAKFVKSCTK